MFEPLLLEEAGAQVLRGIEEGCVLEPYPAVVAACNKVRDASNKCVCVACACKHVVPLDTTGGVSAGRFLLHWPRCWHTDKLWPAPHICNSSSMQHSRLLTCSKHVCVHQQVPWQ